MKPFKLSSALAAALLLAVPFVSYAQEAAPEEEASSPVTWSLAATTDYVFRGVSQTDEGPAFQAGLTYTAPFGLYVGAWGSNVDFGDPDPENGVRGVDKELDLFVGYSYDFNDSWNLDVSALRYTYHGASGGVSSGDYNEFLAKVTWAGPVEVTGLLAYAPDYGDLTPKAKESYANISASYEFGDSGISLGGGVGYTSVDYGEEWLEGERINYGVADYFDGALTLSKGFGPATATLGYYTTFGSDADELKDASGIYDDRIALTISIGN